MIVIDIETTGTNPRQHAIITIGAIEFENPDNQFYSEAKVWEGAKIDEESLPIHGFSIAEITDKTKESQYILLKSFIDWFASIEDHTPAGLHIGGFDLQFLEIAANRENLAWPLGKRSVDLHSLVFAHLHVYNRDLYTIKNNHTDIYGNFIQKYCGLPTIPKPHNALTDAKWEAECFSRLLYGKNLLPDYAQYPVPDKLLQS
jgi:DNA polymerase III epsilon subunit-like protein